MRKSLAIIFVFANLITYGGKDIAGLKQKLYSNNPKIAFQATLDLANAYCNEKSNSDSALYFSDRLDELIFKHAILNTNVEKGKAAFLKGLIYQRKGNYFRSNKYIKECIDITPRDSIKPFYYFYYGLNHKKLGNYSHASEFYLKASKIYEQEGNRKAVASIYNNIGNIFQQIEQYPKALEFLQKALTIAKEDSLQKILPKIYNSMGNVFQEMKSYDFALAHFQKAYDNVVLQNNQKGKFLSLVNLASAKLQLGQSKGALANLEEALRISEKLNNDNYLLKAYYEIGRYFVHSGSKQQAEYYLGKSKVIADSLQHLPDQKHILKAYRDLYHKIGMHKKAYSYYEQYEAIKDTAINRENSLKVTQLTSEFEFEKKEQKLILLEQEKELLKEKDAKKQIENERLEALNDKRTLFNYLLGGIGILFLALSATGFYLFTIKQKKSNELEMINIELEEKSEEITQQRDVLNQVNHDLEKINVELVSKHNEIELQKEEIRAQRDLVSSINDELSVKNKDVTDSIHYAQKIQQAMLNSSFELEQSDYKHFIFYKPRDIVSGDFYWSHVVGDELILAIGDCTGHGVPGAFMSCLGISLLNEIVFERKVVTPNLILEELRNSIIKLITSGRANNEAQIGDGMDIAIINLNIKTNKMLFSGAMNGVKVLRNNEVTELKGDKSPIGMHIIPDHEFSLTEYQLLGGDDIYLSTDGYKDQFGGPRGKKFGNRQLNEMLCELSSMDIPRQYTEIISRYKTWKSKEEQIDDVCLLGLRINNL